MKSGSAERTGESSAGFTLIELLVVIAIIALLMSIIMPTLSKVKGQAKAVMCQSNLHQWAFAMKMYTDDNDGLFMEELGLSRPNLKPYYKDDQLLLCPAATRSYDEGARSPFAAHYYYDSLSSYGHNSWICSQVAASRQTDEKMWKTVNVKGGGFIPMIFDCAGYQNASPWHMDEPPEFVWQFITGTSFNEMRYVCLNRHNEHVNMLFLDFTVRRVGLKELWELKWHRNWNTTNEPPPAWPEWMEHMRDYYVP
jgi:prepilin-type N-terminal cleavage/methylation domain-containing protein/prepilin-type processing-associated H-X9-DG protein